MIIDTPGAPEPPEKADKIVELFPGSELEITRHDQAKKCKCYNSSRRILVCEATRTIECSVCKGLVDPFEYLLKWANEGDRKMEGIKNVQIQIRIAHAEHDDLMRKIRNARSALKRRGQPQPDVERRRYDLMRMNPGKVVELGLYEKGDESA